MVALPEPVLLCNLARLRLDHRPLHGASVSWAWVLSAALVLLKASLSAAARARLDPSADDLSASSQDLQQTELLLLDGAHCV